MTRDTNDFMDVPILNHKHYQASSVFTPQNLLREARRQKGLEPGLLLKRK